MRYDILLTLGMSMILLACATSPKDPPSAVDTFRKFLLDTETPFPKRAARVGLKIDLDPTKLPLGEPTRLEASTGNLIRYSRLRIHGGQFPIFYGSMTNIFDTKVICIKRSDLAALGQIYPGEPILEHRMIGRELFATGVLATPEHLTLEGTHGTIEVKLVTFEQGCLAEIEHGIQIVKR